VYLSDTIDGWKRAFRQVAQLDSIPEDIQHEFQLKWFSSKGLARECDDKHALPAAPAAASAWSAG
jgi:hypothetical protein